MDRDPSFRIFIMPHPRAIEEIFDQGDMQALEILGQVVVHPGPTLTEEQFLELASDAHVIIGQFDLPAARLAKCRNLGAVINVEGNLQPNIDYEHCFRNGIRVLSVSHVFAEPVAEIGLAMAIDLGRGISRSDRLMRDGNEHWGLSANVDARTLFHAEVGLIGFGDLGRALVPLLRPFRVAVRVYDPWLPQLVIRNAECEPASLEQVLRESDFVFVVAGATADNEHFLGREQFASMRRGAALLLLSRAAVVDFPALVAAARSGLIKVATDVFPTEPVDANDPVRREENVLLSPHQAGALMNALRSIGKSVVADVELMARRLPPIVCKQAQPETASRFRSKHVAMS